MSTTNASTELTQVAGSALRITALCLLLLGVPFAIAQEADSATTPESDVDRLRGLLQRHHGADSEQFVDVPPILGTSLEMDPAYRETDLAAALKAPYSAEKVRLRGDELSLLLADVTARLNDPQTADRRSDASMFGTIRIRQGGILVSSSTYSLTHIGKYQFFGHAELDQGRNVLGVGDAQWEIELSSLDEGKGRHLLLLVAPPREDWRLHALPASAAAQLGDDAPQWLREPSTDVSPTL
ncbi:hypothetical protein [Congregibacter sp.]|uniref:hypothetical protein n=1 Tax=Congregibacter sp. TaxID=2744308 RepID=UPI0039E4FE61